MDVELATDTSGAGYFHKTHDAVLEVKGDMITSRCANSATVHQTKIIGTISSSKYILLQSPFTLFFIPFKESRSLPNESQLSAVDPFHQDVQWNLSADDRANCNEIDLQL